MSSLQRAALVTALCCSTSVALAHAPLPRGLAIAPNGGPMAVRMPGFGWLLRASSSAASEPAFTYACDALVGVSPIEERAPMAYRSDGTLLVGSANGLRMLSAAGCPVGVSPLSGLPVTALAVQTADVGRAYAITEAVDLPPAVQRSDDGGQTWTMTAQLAAFPVTALVLDPSDPQALYVSQTTATQEASVSVSHDGGETFESFTHDRALTLLHVQSAPQRIWAMQRLADMPVGVAILRAEQPEGPWTEVLTVNFFGGLAFDASDANVVWVGDEARGVFRSSDGGDSFEETQPSIASACLTYGASALWSCTPGLPTQTALRRSSDAIEPFDPIMAFVDADHLVECGAEVDVAQVCAAAWIEWQRDVLGITPVLPDAGAMNEPDAAAMNAQDAAAGPVAEPVAMPASESGCAVSAAHQRASLTWLLMLLALGLLARRARFS